MFPFKYILAGINACNLQTCLEWRISVDELTLICKIDNLHLLVLIDDPAGSTRADCYPDTEHTTCESYYENESITQNPTTKEIVYTVHGKIDHHLNGKWSCRHGTRLNVATVEVTVLERCTYVIMSFNNIQTLNRKVSNHSVIIYAFNICGNKLNEFLYVDGQHTDFLNFDLSSKN